MRDAVAVEIELGSALVLDEAVTLLIEDPHDAPVRLRLVALDVASLAAGVVFQPAPDVIEGVADGDIDVFRVVAIDQDLAARYGQIDTDVEEFALMLVPADGPHGDPAAHDVLVIAVELVHLLLDGGFDGVRAGQVPEYDLGRQLHGVFLGQCC